MNKWVASIKNYQVLNFTAAWEGLWIKDVKCFPSQFCQVSAGTKAAENCLCSKKKKKKKNRTAPLDSQLHGYCWNWSTNAHFENLWDLIQLCRSASSSWCCFFQMQFCSMQEDTDVLVMPCYILASITEEELGFTNNFWNTFFRSCKFLELLQMLCRSARCQRSLNPRGDE